MPNMENLSDYLPKNLTWEEKIAIYNEYFAVDIHPKLHEVRLGNLFIDPYYQIYAIDERQLNHEFIKGWIKIDLNEYWLLKFNFEKKETNHFTLYVLNNVQIWYVNKQYMNDNGVLIQYVHQLQNLYFALTEEELKYD